MSDITTDGVHSEPPPLPPQDVTKYKHSIQFPKCLTLPARRCFVCAADRGWFGEPKLQTHVVVCGFPRSGSTLLQLMIESCVANIRTYGRERKGIQAARCYHRTHPLMMTKRPSDIFAIRDIQSHYARIQPNVKFVLMTRDPRAVLTSYHAQKPGDYYVSPERWRGIYSYWQWACNEPDVTVIRYEDLISDPNTAQQQLADFIGWEVKHPFAEFHTAVPDNFRTIALNGVRKLDPKNIHRWKKPEHTERLRTLLAQELPELARCLIELGYEADESWTEEYLKDPVAIAA